MGGWIAFNLLDTITLDHYSTTKHNYESSDGLSVVRISSLVTPKSFV